MVRISRSYILVCQDLTEALPVQDKLELPVIASGLGYLVNCVCYIIYFLNI